MVPRSGERPCGRIINFDGVEDEFDEEMADWFKLGASMVPVVRDGGPDGPYAQAKCRHQEAAETMAANLNRLRQQKRAAARAARDC